MKWALFYTTSPCLTSIHSATVQNYNSAKQRDLTLVLKFLAVSLLAWSHEQNSGLLEPTCIACWPVAPTPSPVHCPLPCCVPLLYWGSLCTTFHSGAARASLMPWPGTLCSLAKACICLEDSKRVLFSHPTQQEKIKWAVGNWGNLIFFQEIVRGIGSVDGEYLQFTPF